MNKRKGYRGYIGSRPYRGDRTPQHVQNLVVRDYCQRNSFNYLLSATEYAMSGSYIMLSETLHEAPTINGVVLYSIFMLPKRQKRRLDICRQFLKQGASLHGALENVAITNEYDLKKIDEMLMLNEVVIHS